MTWKLIYCQGKFLCIKNDTIYNDSVDTRHYYLGFSYAPGIGPKRLQQLLQQFGSIEQVWKASEQEFQSCLGSLTTEKFIDFRKKFNFEKTVEELEKKKIMFVTIEDSEYPQLLKQTVIASDNEAISNPEGISFARNDIHIPFILYVKGNIRLLNESRTIGIVGTRKISDYGKQVTQMITEELVWNHVTIVSGLAYGVDAYAHAITLKNNGQTIAVLGSGVDYCTPAGNQRLYDAILDKSGTIVSTFLPGLGATVGSFPARNAIIAGLSQAIVVTEGAADSGSLITAKDAQKFGRQVFAVPGPITSHLSKGSNSLLQEGAIAVTSGEDIIRALKIDDGKLKLGLEDRNLKIDNQSSIFKHQNRSSTIYDQLSSDEKEIITVLELGPLHFDEIVRTIGKSAKEIGGILSLMELKGVIRNTNSIYSLK